MCLLMVVVHEGSFMTSSLLPVAWMDIIVYSSEYKIHWLHWAASSGQSSAKESK